MHQPASSGPHPDESTGALSIGGVMSTFFTPAAHGRRGELSLSASPRRLAAATLVAALTFALVAGATAAPAAAAPRTPSAAATAPVFDAEYLDGVSGAEPAKEVNLAGTWDFTPLTNTIVHRRGTFRHDHRAVPLVCRLPCGRWADHDPGARRRLGQAGLDRPLPRHLREDDQRPRVLRGPGDAPQLRRHQPPRHGHRGRTHGGHPDNVLHRLGVRSQRLRHARGGAPHRGDGRGPQGAGRP